MSCYDCGGQLPARPWGRPTPTGPQPLCTLCMIRWRDSDRGAVWAPLLGWVLLALLGLLVIVIVLGGSR